MKSSFTFFICILFSLRMTASCQQTIQPGKHIQPVQTASISKQDSLYELSEQNRKASISEGSVSNGSLRNGKLLPFTGPNFHYFDTVSYMLKRGFMNEKVRNSLLSTYKALEGNGLNYGIMECSNEDGGKLEPHRTHQNGMSVDFVSPLLRDGKACTDYDYIGSMHYFMDFDNDGNYLKDPIVSIDFEAISKHLLVLSDAAAKQGLKIEKVIWKMELQDELFATESGKKLKAKGIYVTKKLSPMINQLHDDHYHVDFKML